MRVVYSSDLHGHITFYRQLLDLALATDARVAIVGGDLLPHGTSRATGLDVQRGFVHHELAPLLHEYKTRQPDLSLYVIPGNDDWAAAYESVAALEAEDLVINLHHRAASIADDVWLAGSGLVGLTPFAIKDYERRDTASASLPRVGQAFRSDRGVIESLDPQELLERPSLADELARLAQQSDPRRTIYVFHCPPWATHLDRRTGGAPTGSRAIHDFIMQHQPPLTLHGHIHESPAVSGAWLEQVGRTIAINPGQPGRDLHAVTFDTDDIRGSIRHTVYH